MATVHSSTVQQPLKKRTPVPPAGARPGISIVQSKTAPSWEALSKLLECTVCFETMEGPIYQCHEGVYAFACPTRRFSSLHVAN
jgi:hypothetical protein